MKKAFTFLAIGIALFAGKVANAQSFTVLHDTIVASGTAGSGSTEIHNDITNTTASTITMQWKVIANNFPADWMLPKVIGVCDRNLCYTPADFWPTQTQEAPYLSGVLPGDFHMLFDYDSAVTTGTYYMTIRLNNKLVPGDVDTVTYQVSKIASGAVSPTPKVSGEVSLYPNPAGNDFHLTYTLEKEISRVHGVLKIRKRDRRRHCGE